MKNFCLRLMTLVVGSSTILGTVSTAIAFPAKPGQSIEYAGLFRTLNVIEDVDDALDGNFGQIDPVRNVTENIEDGLDDVNDTIYDVTHINPIEPFTDVDD